MKRIKSAGCLQIGIALAVVLLLSACAAEKRAPQNHTLPDDTVYIAESKVAEMKITAPAELGFMVKGACAGAACGLLAQVEVKPVPAVAQCSFPADKPAPEPAVDRQAGATPAADGNDNVDNVKQEEKESSPVGAYRQPAHRAVPEYERRNK
jgi:hypothetical protein